MSSSGRIEHGWAPEEISYTGTNLSDRDLARILPTGCHLNVDLLCQLERVGRMAPGRAVGIRVNPRAGATHAGGGESAYAGAKPTKFGIYPERLADAIEIARRHDLTIDTVHVHSGYLYFNDSLDMVDEVMRRIAEATATLVEAGCPIVEVNTGGGLGVPFRPADEPLDLAAWSGDHGPTVRAAGRHGRDRAGGVHREAGRSASRRGGHGRRS